MSVSVTTRGPDRPRRRPYHVLAAALAGLALSAAGQLAAATPAAAQPGELGLNLTKTATVSPARPGGAEAGDTITYTYRVTNTGIRPLNPVTVTDNRIPTSPFACGNGALVPGRSRTCTATYVVTAADVRAGHVNNLATATGRFGTETVTSPGASVDIPTAGRDAELTIDKRARVVPASHRNAVQVGDRIYYTYLVTNTGNVTVTEIRVRDSLVRVNCPTTPLEPGRSVLCEARPYVVTAADVRRGRIVNTARATGRSEGGVVTSDPDSVTIRTVRREASLTIDKRARVVPARHHDAARVGDRIYYTYLVTNTGDVTVTRIRVTDSRVRVTCPNTPLRPGRSVLCEARPYVVTAADVRAGKIVNTARATGRARGDVVTSDPDSVTVRTARRPHPCVAGTKGCGDHQEQLPVTGNPTLQLAGWGGGLVTLGALLLGVARPRRRPSLQV